ncbi:hypothetical protein [Lysobacter capsici]|uniref:hypothetical protein n=1 Tax=Lysobacter capsici TaxID=435897 RepID=UPI00287B7099|nr:hypothetical protein [Lysobacter capsici]WND79852.1 hypothetical protein RJ610_21610 [Lysobacter capsici]WND85048.1 hypothetical protein RJ609_21625 [Lysobacter capsici]
MSLLLRYSGPTVDDGRMGVYDVAANMVTFSDYVIAAAHTMYGSDVEVRAEVSAFSHGSFETDLLFHVAGMASALFASEPNVVALCTTVRESLELFKFLKGEPPKEISQQDRSVNVENNNGQILVVNIDSLSLTMNPKAGEAAAQFIGRALETAGVEAVSIGSGRDELIEVDESEGEYFRPLSMDVDRSEYIVPDMKLQISVIGFRDGLKWKFSDGAKNIAAAVEDKRFLERVEGGEAFRKGDVLVCDVRVVQSVAANGRLKTQHSIIEVKQHLSRAAQPSISFDDE